MVAVHVDVTGGEALKKFVQGWLTSRPVSVKAGVLETATTNNGKSVLDYAPIQEFGGSIRVTKKMRYFLGLHYGIWLKKTKGSINIPPRSFMRTTFAQHNRKWVAIMARFLKQRAPIEAALSYVGREMQADIEQTILSNMPPPLSEMTKKIKAIEAPASVDRTLYATGTLAHSIRYQIIESDS